MRKFKLIKSMMKAEQMSRLPVAHGHNGNGYAMIRIIPRPEGSPDRPTIQPEEYRGADAE